MKEELYKGSRKTLYQLDDPSVMLMSFNDTMELSNKKSITVSGKGVLVNTISAFLMQKLKMVGIESHFIEKKNMRQQLINIADVNPIQIHVSTLATGRYVTDLGMENGLVFNSPAIDFRLKNKKNNYPSINEFQMHNFGWLHKEDIKEIKEKALKVYGFLFGLFIGVGIRLVDIKLEFGHVFNTEEFACVVVDEISPDTCTLWDLETNEKLCYELAEEDPDKIIPAYQEVIRRLKIKNS